MKCDVTRHQQIQSISRPFKRIRNSKMRPARDGYIPPFQNMNIPKLNLCDPIYWETPEPSRPYSHTDLPFTNIAAPAQYFSLFFNNTILDQIVSSTNSYAAMKIHMREQENPSNSGRFWIPITRPELQIWIGIVFYMAFLGLSQPTSCWNSSTRVSQVANYMSLRRYEAIRRYIHTKCTPGDLGAQRATEEDAAEDNDDLDEATRVAWYAKLEPIATPLRSNYKKYLKIRSEVAIDEMMVKFTGQTYYTVKMKRKLIKEGYKVF